MKNNSTDTLYAKRHESVGSFIFDEKVANIFDDMINRSVPGYQAIISMIGILADEHVTANSHVYDLGCSLGAATLSILRSLHHSDCKIIAVDNSSAMLGKCKKNVLREGGSIPVEYFCQDLRETEIKRASMVVLNFTLQFIEVDKREELIRCIYRGMLPGGILVISEKIVFEDKRTQSFQEEMHLNFKRLNGYSHLEIAQKRSALEKILVPDTLEEHQRRLNTAGFRKTTVWFQCFNFVSIISFK